MKAAKEDKAPKKAKREHMAEVEKPSITQKICPDCGKRAEKIARDRMGMRTCPDGHTWYPTKMKADK